MGAAKSNADHVREQCTKLDTITTASCFNLQRSVLRLTREITDAKVALRTATRAGNLAVAKQHGTAILQKQRGIDRLNRTVTRLQSMHQRLVEAQALSSITDAVKEVTTSLREARALGVNEIEIQRMLMEFETANEAMEVASDQVDQSFEAESERTSEQSDAAEIQRMISLVKSEDALALVSDAASVPRGLPVNENERKEHEFH